MSESYDPSTSPFEIPVGILRADCRLERPLVLQDRAGANLRTSLRGAFGEALVGLGCRRPELGGTCLDRAGRRGCAELERCAVPWLFEPHVACQRRDHPSPVILKISGGDGRVGDDGRLTLSVLELTVVLLGRHAVRNRTLILDALARTGHGGLIERSGGASRGRDAVGFDVTAQAIFEGTLDAWVAARTDNRSPAAVMLELATPLAANPPDFATLLGNVAHDVVQWDLADSGRAAERGTDAKAWCDGYADHAREQVRSALAGVAVDGQLEEAQLGRRRSRSTGGAFELAGFTGWLALRGDLEPVLPWLVALELRGGGRKKSFGLGEVRLGLGGQEA